MATSNETTSIEQKSPQSYLSNILDILTEVVGYSLRPSIQLGCIRLHHNILRHNNSHINTNQFLHVNYQGTKVISLASYNCSMSTVGDQAAEVSNNTLTNNYIKHQVQSYTKGKVLVIIAQHYNFIQTSIAYC